MSNVVPIGPRASKEEFLRALNIDPSDSRAESWYRQMRDEAITVFFMIMKDRNNLIEEKQRDLSIEPPFYWHHIRPDVQRGAIRTCWQRAKPGSSARHFFDLGATDGEYAPNWVTSWLLYSVFRARDKRNNRDYRNRQDGRGGCSTPTQRSRTYDPVRDTR